MKLTNFAKLKTIALIILPIPAMDFYDYYVADTLYGKYILWGILSVFGLIRLWSILGDHSKNYRRRNKIDNTYKSETKALYSLENEIIKVVKISYVLSKDNSLFHSEAQVRSEIFELVNNKLKERMAEAYATPNTQYKNFDEFWIYFRDQLRPYINEGAYNEK